MNDSPERKLLIRLRNRAGRSEHPAGPVVRHRARKSWNAWHAMRPFFCFHKGSVLKMLRLFHMTVASAVLWGLECVGTRELDRSVLNVSCLTMLSGMLWVSRSPEETWEEHFVRNRQQTRKINEAAGHHFWGSLASKRQPTFAGHVARLPEDRVVNVVCGAHGIATWRTTH